MRSPTKGFGRGGLLLVLLAAPVVAQPPADPSETSYVIDGHIYRPADAPLDAVGYAGIIAMSGGTTASGEAFAAAAITGAHKTLPIPSFVEVTSLATGRTILVRINERGPFVNDRLIDLSCGAVRQLGLTSLPGSVRVRRVNPAIGEGEALRAGREVALRQEPPPGLLDALRRRLPPPPTLLSSGDCRLVPVASILPPPRSHWSPPAPVEAPGYAIQVAALSSRARADALARSLGGHVETSGALYRVRTGSYTTEAAARAALPQIRAKGFADARVVPNGRP